MNENNYEINENTKFVKYEKTGEVFELAKWTPYTPYSRIYLTGADGKRKLSETTGRPLTRLINNDFIMPADSEVTR